MANALFDMFWEKQAKKVFLNNLKKGKTLEQKRCIDFFWAEGGCLKKNSTGYTMDEYQKLVLDKCATMNFKARAMEKIGLDESLINEIPPVFLSSFCFDDKFVGDTDIYTKVSGSVAVSSVFSITWIFFGKEQLYTYTYKFDMTSDNTYELTRDYFYTDVTCIDTVKEVREKIDISLSGCGCLKKKKENVTKNNFVVDEFEIVVPGSSYSFSMKNSDTLEQSIQAAKAMIREKKYEK